MLKIKIKSLVGNIYIFYFASNIFHTEHRFKLVTWPNNWVYKTKEYPVIFSILNLVSNAMKVFISKLMKAVPLEEYFAVFIEEKTNFHVL